ncbi:hypothetical protein ACFPL7_15980 [Dongia soli]|uniref:Uncharacterized protein n=1 Tax=Dongia soli TaxID=600628 RepID=A0ABU5EHX1_9PROT|nr:hypothetical protein [Dongia soli]MDY0885897.1 hypothetical protein [Dongia soli]
MIRFWPLVVMMLAVIAAPRPNAFGNMQLGRQSDSARRDYRDQLAAIEAE